MTNSRTAFHRPIRTCAGLALAGAPFIFPAVASADESDPNPDLGAARNDVGTAPASAGTVDAGAARNDVGTAPALSATVDVRRMLNDIDTPLGPVPVSTEPATQVPPSDPSVIRVDDGAWELGQLVLGATVGAALTATGAVVILRRREPSPA